MKNLFTLLLLLQVGMFCSVYADTYTSTYGWENAGITILGSYAYQHTSPPEPVTATNVTTPYVFSGARSLEIRRNSSSTPQAYLIWIEGLQHGDEVKAGFWCYDDTHGSAPSARIWAHYTRDSVGSYAGSASGPNEYSGPDWPGDGNDWWFLQANWTFDEGDTQLYDPREGMIIEVRVYGTGGTVWVDDAYVTVPDHATVHFGQLDNHGFPAEFPVFDEAVTCQWLRSDIAGRDPASDTVWNRRNFYGDCLVDFVDLELMASQWLFDNNLDVYEDLDYSDYQHVIYDWEDSALISDPSLSLVWVDPYHHSGNGPFNSFNYAWAELTEDGGGYPNTGRAIECHHPGGSNTGQLYVAWIKNLSAGDLIGASVYLKDADNGKGSMRLWANYGRFYGAFAGGSNHGDIDFSNRNFAESLDNGWARHSAEWIFDEGTGDRDQMIIVIRTYATDDSYGPRLAGWADDLVVSAPAHAEIVFPTQASLNTEVVTPDGMVISGSGNLVPGFQDLICPIRPYADLNHDCKVGLADFAYMANEWLDCGFSNCN